MTTGPAGAADGADLSVGTGICRSSCCWLSIRRFGSHPILPFGASDIVVGANSRSGGSHHGSPHLRRAIFRQNHHLTVSGAPSRSVVAGDSIIIQAPCQWPLVSARRWPVFRPAGGHENCPLVASWFARVGGVGAGHRVGLVQWHDSLSVQGLGEADGVAGGLADVGVVQHPTWLKISALTG